MALRIEDYALIGDCESAALVGRNGSIDWLCWPRFDSPACMAALLGGPDNGHWKIAPADATAAVTRQYLKDTLILETRFRTAEGEVALIDFMPQRGQNIDLVRIVRGISGKVPMRMDIVLRFDYGLTVPWVSRRSSGDLTAVAGPHRITLSTPVAINSEDYSSYSEFVVSAGQEIPFVLTHSPSHLPVPAADDPLQALVETEAFWMEWSSRCKATGPWAETIRRSLLILKALTYRPTGSIVAAPTTSLPEWIGGARNWDYRYCWLRDSAFLLLAFMDSGYLEEAHAWRDWLIRAVAGSPRQMQIMYGLGGERFLPEQEIRWLPGYENSRPVRIGNGAASQRQLDVYGEVADVLFLAHRYGVERIGKDWSLLCNLLDHLAEIWREPDEGIWEVRQGRSHFTHSKVMSWVAFDRGVRLVEEFGFEGPVDTWRAIRQEIHDEVCMRAWNPDRNSFVQAYGSDQLDASVLLMPAVGFIAATDPRMVSTVKAIEDNLMEDGLVMRYRPDQVDEALWPKEGTFLICSFWLCDVLILQGRTQDARRLFEKLLGLCNDLGLLSEEYDPESGRMLGNFPQAYSHIGILTTALNLSRAMGPTEQRAGDGS
ncbi:MAG: glycoside hydrolase family 15 protein [Pseudomonadota bacterium]|nr:glycoside hydrolase family 15 protein [Pseudomonadota bacterium]